MSELDAAGLWLEDEGFDATAKQFNDKIKGLNKTASPIFNRVKEWKGRTKVFFFLAVSFDSHSHGMQAINTLFQSLNYTHQFLSKVKNISEVWSGGYRQYHVYHDGMPSVTFQ